MLKNPKKRIKIRTFIYGLVLAVILGILVLPVVWIRNRVKKIHDVKISQRSLKKPSALGIFTDVKFQNLQIGMSQKEVLYRLGKPLGKATSCEWDVWCYMFEKIKYPVQEHGIIFNFDVSDNRVLYFFKGKLAEIEMSLQGSHLWPKYYYISNNCLSSSPYGIPRGRVYYGYAIAFSEERFGKVQKGMTKQQVIDLLGEPMDIKKETTETENWVYGYGSGCQDKRIVARFIFFSNNQVSKIEKSHKWDM